MCIYLLYPSQTIFVVCTSSEGPGGLARRRKYAGALADCLTEPRHVYTYTFLPSYTGYLYLTMSENMSDTYLARRGLCANSEGPASVLVWAFAGRYIDGLFHTLFHAQGKIALKVTFACAVCCKCLQISVD